MQERAFLQCAADYCTRCGEKLQAKTKEIRLPEWKPDESVIQILLLATDAAAALRDLPQMRYG